MVVSQRPDGVELPHADEILKGDDAISIADGNCLHDKVLDFHNLLLKIRNPTLPNGGTWAVLDSKSFAYFKQFRATITHGRPGSVFAVDYMAIPICHRDHYSLMVVPSPSRIVAPSKGGQADAVELILYDSAGVHSMDAGIFNGVKSLLHAMVMVELPHIDEETVKGALMVAKCVTLGGSRIPMQTNGVDCGVFVCQNLAELVATSFQTVRDGLSFDRPTPHVYRRGMRAELCDHRAGTLATKLQAKGIVMPTQPPPAKALDPAIVVQDDDDIVELKSEGGMQSTDMQLVVLAAKLGAISLALGYDEDQLLAGAAHFLTTHARVVAPIVKGMGSGKDPETVARSIAGALHTTPLPLPRHPAGQAGVRLSKLTTKATSPRPGSKPPSPHTPHLVMAIPASEAGISGCRKRASGANVGKPPRAREGTREGRTVHTGVRYDPETGKYYAKLVWGRGSRQQIRLGSYTEELDAAYAYAAAAHVLRPKVISKGAVRLSDSDIAALSGCTGEHIRALVRKRKWWRWREWTVALRERGQVFQGQGEGHDAAVHAASISASEDSDAHDDDVYPLTQECEGDVHMAAEGEADGGCDGGSDTNTELVGK
ncbi:unnamed protein product [Closterium sp. Yama58-4]|nr:unnamed protein product [Closterium sp. Yama58-4]